MRRDGRGIRTRVGIAWNGQRWVGDTPDYTADSAPDAELGAFIMLPEGVARLFVPGPVRRRTVVGALRAGRVAGRQSAAPGAELEPGRAARSAPSSTCSARPTSIPIVCTTYRLTEHFHYWTKNNPYNVQLQPEFFVEIPEELAREKGIANGDRVRVTSARGSIEGRAMVTRRIKPMQVGGQTVYQIGFPIHWGFLGRGAAARLAGQSRDADRSSIRIRSRPSTRAFS